MNARARPRPSIVARCAWCLVALIAFAGPAARAQLIERVLAVVNGEPVTWLDVRAAIEFELVPESRITEGERAVLEALIDRELMLADAGRYGVREPDEAVVAERLALIRARFPSEPAFDDALARTGVTRGRLRMMLRDTVRLEAHLAQRFDAAAQPTDDEVARYYRAHQAELARGGVTPPLEKVRDEVTAKATAERRSALVAEWIGRLRQRAEIRRLGDPSRQ